MQKPLTIAYITSGAAGMYCGSCMRDNTLAAALMRQGVDVQLIPLYTPIRTDEQDVTIDRIFFGGINVYLQQKIPLFRHVPALVDRLFDQPWLIRWASGRTLKINSRQLGDLTVSMLRGSAGYQRKEVDKLVRWLANDVRPDLVNLSNVLTAGCVGAIKRTLDIPVLVTLQGDDIFLDGLVEPYKSQAFAEIKKLVAQIDGFLVFSRYYADFMSDYLGIPPQKMHIVPMGIDLNEFRHETREHMRPADRPPTIGYLARLAPEKGLHLLVDAFIRLKQIPELKDARLHLAGWLGDANRTYVDKEFARLKEAKLEDAFHYAGTVDRHGKHEFLNGLDVLSVPTIYREPKGIYVLESLAAGVPVVQPEHGAFPELLALTGGGRLVRPNDPDHLAETLAELLLDHDGRLELGRQGRETVHQTFHADMMAQATLETYRRFLQHDHQHAHRLPSEMSNAE